VLILSGDVHYSYVSKARTGPVYQIVCSPIRNPLSRTLRWANVLTQFGVATLIGGLLARSAKLPKPPFRWRVIKGPWFQNAVAMLTFPDAEATWYDSTGDDIRAVGSVKLE
jgi:hypothetical protein